VSRRGAFLTPLLLVTVTAASVVVGQDPATAVRSFEVTASRFAFDPAVLEVSEGDEVRVTLRSSDTTHGFEIKDLKVKAKIPKGGSPVSIVFKAGRPGTYAITCSEYCGSGHRRMKGSLVVAPREAR
jgi:cytochrome c oxidase subunit 2